MSPTTDLVHYVAYGSNLDEARFTTYLQGGTPPGSARTYRGCRNPQAAAESIAATIPHRLRFVGESKVWGGSLAVIDAGPVPGEETLVVAHLVHIEQFYDIVAQENGGEAPGDAFDLPETGRTVRLAHGGIYDTVVGLEPLDSRGHRAVTFTTSLELSAGAPSSAYAATIAAGLCAHHGHDPAAARRYIERAARRVRQNETPALSGA